MKNRLHESAHHPVFNGAGVDGLACFGVELQLQRMKLEQLLMDLLLHHGLLRLHVRQLRLQIHQLSLRQAHRQERITLFSYNKYYKYESLESEGLSGEARMSCSVHLTNTKILNPWSEFWSKPWLYIIPYIKNLRVYIITQRRDEVPSLQQKESHLLQNNRLNWTSGTSVVHCQDSTPGF